RSYSGDGRYVNGSVVVTSQLCADCATVLVAFSPLSAHVDVGRLPQWCLAPHAWSGCHVVAGCPICDLSFRYTELASDILGESRTNMCPRCRQDLTEAVRAHLFRCAWLPSEVRLKAKAVREAAQRLVKEAQQLRDRSDVLIREAEAALFERQRALREAMSKRTAS